MTPGGCAKKEETTEKGRGTEKREEGTMKCARGREKDTGGLDLDGDAEPTPGPSQEGRKSGRRI